MMMKKATAANLALVLVVLAWPMMLYGSLSQMGDPAPDAREAVEAARFLSSAILIAGLLSLLASLVLAGYALAAAKVRAGIALAAGLIPLALIGGMIMSLSYAR